MARSRGRPSPGDLGPLPLPPHLQGSAPRGACTSWAAGRTRPSCRLPHEAGKQQRARPREKLNVGIQGPLWPQPHRLPQGQGCPGRLRAPGVQHQALESPPPPPAQEPWPRCFEARAPAHLPAARSGSGSPWHAVVQHPLHWGLSSTEGGAPEPDRQCGEPSSRELALCCQGPSVDSALLHCSIPGAKAMPCALSARAATAETPAESRDWGAEPPSPPPCRDRQG